MNYLLKKGLSGKAETEAAELAIGLGRWEYIPFLGLSSPLTFWDIIPQPLLLPVFRVKPKLELCMQTYKQSLVFIRKAN